MKTVHFQRIMTGFYEVHATVPCPEAHRKPELSDTLIGTIQKERTPSGDTWRTDWLYDRLGMSKVELPYMLSDSFRGLQIVIRKTISEYLWKAADVWTEYENSVKT